MEIRELERQGFSFRALGSLVSDRNPQDIGPAATFTMQIRELERCPESSFRALGPQDTGGNDHIESDENTTTRHEFNASEKAAAEVVQADAAESQAE